MKEVYDKFGLEATTKDFIGHAMALYHNDAYIDEKGRAPEAIERIKLYGNSVARYGKSPYIYPLYGLGELPQGFARLSAIYGGTYMLNTKVEDIQYENGKATGIKATMTGIEPPMTFETKAKMIIGDPSYFPDKVKVVGHVLRAICILKHPLEKTNDADSCQIIIPQSQVGRKHDIYIACVSSAHNVCPKGYYIAIVSTIAETSANHHLELQPGLDRLGKIEEQFMVSSFPPPSSDCTFSRSNRISPCLGPANSPVRAARGRHQGQHLHLQELRRQQSLRVYHGGCPGYLPARDWRGACD